MQSKIGQYTSQLYPRIKEHISQNSQYQIQHQQIQGQPYLPYFNSQYQQNQAIATNSARNNCVATFNNINHDYFELINKVQDKIKQLEHKCLQDNLNISPKIVSTSFSQSYVNNSESSHIFQNNSAQEQYHSTSIVQTTNPNNIKNIINEQIYNNRKNQQIARYSYVHNNPNSPTFNYSANNNEDTGVQEILKQYQTLNKKIIQHNYQLQHEISKNKQINNSWGRDHAEIYNQRGNLIQKSKSLTHFSGPISPIEYSTQATLPKLSNNSNQNYPMSRSILASNQNFNFNMGEVMLQNLKTQKQINMNLKVLSQRLLDLSVKKSQTSVANDQKFYRENNNNLLLNPNQSSRSKNICQNVHMTQSVYPLDQVRKNNQSQQKSSNNHNCNQCLRKVEKRKAVSRKKILNKNQKINKQGSQNIQMQRSNSNATPRLQYLDPKTKRIKYKIKGKRNQSNLRENENHIKSQTYSRTKSNKSSKKIQSNNTYNYINLQVKQSQSQSGQGRAKSISSTNSLSKNSKNKKVYTFRVQKKQKNIDVKQQKQLDPDYFDEKKLIRSKNKKSKPVFKSKETKETGNCKAPAIHYISVKEHKQLYNQYCPLHNNVVQKLYDKRKQNKNTQIYRDSQHRNRKHQKQHMLQSFSQQQKLRKQVISKISKNFFQAYGVK